MAQTLTPKIQTQLQNHATQGEKSPEAQRGFLGWLTSATDTVWRLIVAREKEQGYKIPGFHLISAQDRNDIAQVEVLAAYREYQFKGRITTRATIKIRNKVINAVWREARSRRAWLFGKTELTEENGEEGNPPFSAETLEKVEDIERLHHDKVITLLEYFFIIAIVQDYTLEQMAQEISTEESVWNAKTVALRMKVLKEKIDLHTSNPAADIPSLFSTKGRPQKEVEEKVILGAIRRAVGEI